MAMRDSICPECGQAFSYVIGKGKTRKYCGPKCQYKAAKARVAARDFPLCSVEGCCDLAVRVGAGLCEKHHARLRRNGHFDKVDPLIEEVKIQSGGGYLLAYAPNHPLRVGSSPRVYQHRIVFYDAHGEGPFECHCCGKVVTWRDMHVDHLNDDVVDNRVENLAAACAVCNQWRGKHKMAKAMKVKHGLRWTAHGITMCAADWARHLGVSRETIADRLKRGATLDAALHPRVGKHGPASSKKRIPLSELVVIEDHREDKTKQWAV